MKDRYLFSDVCPNSSFDQDMIDEYVVGHLNDKRYRLLAGLQLNGPWQGKDQWTSDTQAYGKKLPKGKSMNKLTFPYARFARMTSPRIRTNRVVVMPTFAPFPLNALLYKERTGERGLLASLRAILSFSREKYPIVAICNRFNLE
ncbi:hypothetical protein Y032_0045g1183 [Ancylostoma ceylanicum]|uniref:Uncharacterized protein n=1 Tax=Ancylostoma ceylanicum TaxID=53326 RepID=A0A016UCS9_9BILA|nr:hypothetical protein Y032_0045g1183 [Ancylostoma ceylanicum]